MILQTQIFHIPKDKKRDIRLESNNSKIMQNQQKEINASPLKLWSTFHSDI